MENLNEDRHITMDEFLSGEITDEGEKIKPSKPIEKQHEGRNQGSRNPMFGKKQNLNSRKKISESMKAYHELHRQNHPTVNGYRTIRSILHEELEKFINENCLLVKK